MFENKNELEAREEILSFVDEYCKKYHAKKEYHEGDRISYASRVYDSAEMKNLVNSALEFWLTAGHYTDEFEKKFGEYLNVKYVSVVNSGSSANLNAFMALTSPLLGDRRIKRGDEVITVAAGFPTTVTPAIQYGAVPVFVDVTIPQYNIDVTKLEEAYSEKTKAVMIAHTLGNPFDLTAVKDFCDKHNLWLVEDNCDALGSKYNYKGEEKFTGTVGDIGTSSFYPPHHMTMGEGGAVYTNNPLLNKCIRSFRDWGRDCVCPSGRDNLCGHRFDKQYGELPLGYDHKYVYSHFGYNLKATDMQAAVGCAQLEKFPSFVERRRHNFDRLRAALEGIQDKVILPVPCEGSRPSWFGFLITVKEGIDRKKVVEYIENHGVQTRNLFAGNLIKHPCFDEMRATGEGFRVVGGLDNTDRIMNDTFWVGVYPGMTDEMIDYMAKTITEAVNQEIMSEKNKALINQIIRFGLVGISNTIVSYVIYAVAFALTDNYFLANVLSWLLSVLHAYFWQNVFVFKEDKNAQKRVWWKVLLKTYAAYAFTGLLLNNLLLWLWVDVIDISRFCTGIANGLMGIGIVLTDRELSGYLGPVLNMFVTIPVNFVMNKFWAYRQKE